MRRLRPFGLPLAGKDPKGPGNGLKTAVPGAADFLRRCTFLNRRACPFLPEI